MRAPVDHDPFLAGFIGFARAEAGRDPAMADAMADLVDALGRCRPLEACLLYTSDAADE